MKALISALIALTGFQALADGIPQAPTSPYFYSCQVDGPAGGNNQRTYLHVDESFSEYASLWVTYYGGVVGQAVSKDIWSALKNREIAKLNGARYTSKPTYTQDGRVHTAYERSVQFAVNNNAQSFDMLMEDKSFHKFSVQLRGCRPISNPYR